MLFIFDVDGTLVNTYGTDPLPDMAEHLERLVHRGHLLAVATNQAGPAWGLQTGNPKYPEPEDLGVRFRQIAAILPELAQRPWFVAVGDPHLALHSKDYTDLIRRFVDAAVPLELHISADPEWRKPRPGMLLAACAYYDVAPEQAVFVGDADTDAEAAVAAGTGFASIDHFLADPDAFL